MVLFHHGLLCLTPKDYSNFLLVLKLHSNCSCKLNSNCCSQCSLCSGCFFGKTSGRYFKAAEAWCTHSKRRGKWILSVLDCRVFLQNLILSIISSRQPSKSCSNCDFQILWRQKGHLEPKDATGCGWSKVTQFIETLWNRYNRERNFWFIPLPPYICVDRLAPRWESLFPIAKVGFKPEIYRKKSGDPWWLRMSHVQLNNHKRGTAV